jgi:hypothetical protein
MEDHDSYQAAFQKLLSDLKAVKRMESIELH